MFRFLVLSLGVGLLAAWPAAAQQRRQNNYPPKLPGAQAEVYKKVGDAELKVYVYYPQGHKPSDKRPAIVFFFGGGWRAGSPSQFAEHCKYLASRGMVAMTADYRVASRHGTKAVHCVADGKSAVRWIRLHAQRLGVDPERIAAGGGSAGGHVAACTGVIAGGDETSEDTSISSVPDALVLFNPAVVLAPVEGDDRFDENKIANLRERMGVDPKSLSPRHHVRAGLPPTTIFHGEADTTVPFWTVQSFAAAMTKSGNSCRLVGAPGKTHGFFNFGRDGSMAYRETVRETDRFLAARGFLQGPPTIDRP